MSAFTQRMTVAASGPALARAGVALLAALCLVLAVRLVLLLLGGPTLPAPSAGGVTGTLPRTTTTPLASWHLFGNPPDTQPELARSTLALTLRGTFASADPANGLAFIADADGRERSYQVGDTLPGDALLESVFADYVIVRNGGQRERLGLPGAAAPTPATGAAPATTRSAPQAGDPSGGYLRGIPAFGAPDLATARGALAPDLAALVQTANLLPVSENGRLIGVRIRVPDPALLERFGLGVDDVVTAVNGIPIDGPERRAALEASLRNGSVVTLTVRRGGAERQLSLGL